jgi:cardiolipin synthase A/B
MLKKLIIFLFIFVFLFNQYKPLPKGISYQSPFVFTDNLIFLYDLTFKKNSETITEHKIFEEVFSVIDKAEEFVLVDFFLYNGIYPEDLQFDQLSNKLTQKLLKKKQNNPEMNIIVITDPLNGFYNSYDYWQFKLFRDNDIPVIKTNMNPMRDSNPLYATVWRMFFQWFGLPNNTGWLRNPVDATGPKGSIRSILQLLNLRANHRKIIVTDQGGMILSANPHDYSSLNSNIAFSFDDSLMPYLLYSESAVLKMSGASDLLATTDVQNKPYDNGKKQYQVKLITEGKIKDNLAREIEQTFLGDQINIAMFFFSDRKIAKELVKAVQRGVSVNIILDPNKDAFGKPTNGIPNVTIANDLYKRTNGKINIRWYKTHGEQFHSKIMQVKRKNNSVIIGGSANYTRRNLNNYNLETNIYIKANNSTKLVKEIDDYFSKILSQEYSYDVHKYMDSSRLKFIRYLFQEYSGLSIF